MVHRSENNTSTMSNRCPRLVGVILGVQRANRGSHTPRMCSEEPKEELACGASKLSTYKGRALAADCKAEQYFEQHESKGKITPSFPYR
jgi:hypothetical protein